MVDKSKHSAPVSAERAAHAMEATMGYRLELKPGEYCYYTPEGYALEAYKGDAPAHALYANPQPGCPSEIEVYKGWCWVRPKYNSGNIVDETFRPLFLGPQLGAPVAAQPDVTQQTLDDVMAGIPARDAEIEALRKENAELREQMESIGAGGVKGKVMPGAVGAEPDMFWNADNPEQCQDSIHNLLVEVQCDRTLRVGDIVEIQQAMSLPNISVRVTAVDGEDDDGDLEYEIVNDAAIDAARKEQA